jgi:hypothetical protein
MFGATNHRKDWKGDYELELKTKRTRMNENAFIHTLSERERERLLWMNENQKP